MSAGYIFTVDMSIPWLPTQGVQKFTTDKSVDTILCMECILQVYSLVLRSALLP